MTEPQKCFTINNNNIYPFIFKALLTSTLFFFHLPMNLQSDVSLQHDSSFESCSSPVCVVPVTRLQLPEVLLKK